VSDIERAVEGVYDVLPPLAATIVGDVINGATVTGRVLPEHVQQTLAVEVLGMAAEVSAEEPTADEVEAVARALHAALDWSLRTPPATTPCRQDRTPLTWEQLGDAAHQHWRGQACAAIRALEEHRAGGVS
jgi:hypothetical protein